MLSTTGLVSRMAHLDSYQQARLQTDFPHEGSFWQFLCMLCKKNYLKANESHLQPSVQG